MDSSPIELLGEEHPLGATLALGHPPPGSKHHLQLLGWASSAHQEQSSRRRCGHRQGPESEAPDPEKLHLPINQPDVVAGVDRHRNATTIKSAPQ